MGRAFNPEGKGGGVGWLALGVGVIAWDKFAPETLTNSFRREMSSHPVLSLGALAVTAGHLSGVIPEQFDPITQGAKHLLHIED